MMDHLSNWEWVFITLAVTFLVTSLVYLVFRAAGAGWHRSKAEWETAMHLVKNKTNKESNNGEE